MLQESAIHMLIGSFFSPFCSRTLKCSALFYSCFIKYSNRNGFAYTATPVLSSVAL